VLYREAMDRYHESLVLNRMGDTHRAAGDVGAARESWRGGAADPRRPGPCRGRRRPRQADRATAAVRSLTAPHKAIDKPLRRLRTPWGKRHRRAAARPTEGTPHRRHAELMNSRTRFGISVLAGVLALGWATPSWGATASAGRDGLAGFEHHLHQARPATDRHRPPPGPRRPQVPGYLSPPRSRWARAAPRPHRPDLGAG
jgi:hypothetical protein